MLRIVPDEFPTIQDAVDVSMAGDEVLVRSGIYQENVIITVENLILTGEVDATLSGENLSGVGIFINSNDVVVQGFGIEKYINGISLQGKANLIQKNRIKESHDFGIKMVGSSNKIASNSLMANHVAVTLQGDGNLFENNTIDANMTGGISFSIGGGQGNVFRQNEFIDNLVAITLMADQADNNLIEYNIMSNVSFGINVAANNNIIRDNFIFNSAIFGINNNGNGNIVESNTVDKGNIGVLSLGDGSVLDRNSVSNMLASGFSISGDNSLISSNLLLDNNVGVILIGEDNVLIDNQFIGNTTDIIEV